MLQLAVAHMLFVQACGTCTDNERFRLKILLISHAFRNVCIAAPCAKTLKAMQRRAAAWSAGISSCRICPGGVSAFYEAPVAASCAALSIAEMLPQGPKSEGKLSRCQHMCRIFVCMEAVALQKMRTVMLCMNAVLGEIVCRVSNVMLS